jgi:hypothetical protein
VAQFGEFRNYFTLRLALSTQVVSISVGGGKIADIDVARIVRKNLVGCWLSTVDTQPTALEP